MYLGMWWQPAIRHVQVDKQKWKQDGWLVMTFFGYYSYKGVCATVGK